MENLAGDDGQPGVRPHHLPLLPPPDRRAGEGGVPPLPRRVRPRGRRVLELQQQSSHRRERGGEDCRGGKGAVQPDSDQGRFKVNLLTRICKR